MIIKKNLNKFIKISAVLLTGGILISGDSFKLREIFNSNCIVARAEDSKKEIGETFKTAINFYKEFKNKANFIIKFRRLKTEFGNLKNNLEQMKSSLLRFNVIDESENLNETYINGLNPSNKLMLKNYFDKFIKYRKNFNNMKDDIKKNEDEFGELILNYIEFCRKNSINIWGALNTNHMWYLDPRCTLDNNHLTWVFNLERTNIKNFCSGFYKSLDSIYIEFLTSKDMINIKGFLELIFDLIDSNDLSFNNKYNNLLKQFDEIFDENKTQPNHSTNGTTNPAAINTLATTKNNNSVINGKDNGSTNPAATTTKNNNSVINGKDNGSTNPSAINTLTTKKNNGSVINGKDKGVPKTSIDSCSNLLGFTISSGIVGISSLLSTLKRKRK